MMRSLVEWIGDALLESRIVEQALSRKDFKMKFHHSVDGIIENWGLIKYAEITKQERDICLRVRKDHQCRYKWFI